MPSVLPLATSERNVFDCLEPASAETTLPRVEAFGQVADFQHDLFVTVQPRVRSAVPATADRRP